MARWCGCAPASSHVADVAPLPRYDSKYPTHAVGKDRVAAVLGEHGINMEDHLTQPKHRHMSLQGGYRHLVGKPEGLTWQLKTYTDPNVSHELPFAS